NCGARNWAVDGRDAPSFRSGSAGCLAGRRLRSAQRFRQNFWPTKTAHPEAADQERRKMASLSFGCGLVFLASAGGARKVANVKELQALKALPLCTFCNSCTHLTCASRCASLKRENYGHDSR